MTTDDDGCWDYEVREGEEGQVGLYETGAVSPVQDTLFENTDLLENDVRAMLRAVMRFKAKARVCDEET